MAERLRAALGDLDEPGTRPHLRIPSDFTVTHPDTTLRRLMRAMRSPRPDRWAKRAEGQFHNENWTEECQGVTHDQSSWYISSNKSGKQRVYRFSLAQRQLGYVALAGNGSGHLGDIDYHEGRLYCAMEQPVKIVVIDVPPFSGWWSAGLRDANGHSPPPQSDCPWCAIHPWNGLLYSSDFGNDAPGVEVLRAYRLDGSTQTFRHVPGEDIHLASPVRRVQGAAFSDNGHVVIASDHTDDIRCFSTLNGAYRGRASIQKDGAGEEVEGITIWGSVAYSGEPTQVHVILLDNDWPSGDDVYFKHYQVPSGTDL